MTFGGRRPVPRARRDRVFLVLLKRAYMGTFHHLSHKHLQRYAHEFCGRHNLREYVDQMMALVEGIR